MLTIDVQVHAYERNHPGRPWLGTLRGPAEVTGDQMAAAMDSVGVDRAVLVSPFSMYGYDASYAIAVHAAHPSRFRLVKPVDPNDPAVADTIADWAATKGTVGIRIMMRDNVSTDPADPGINRALAAAARHSLPVNLMCWGRLEQAGQLAARNPNTRLVIDTSACNSRSSRPRPRRRSPICQRCWRWRPMITSRSRSAGPARCRTNHSPTRICGIRSAASSMPLASLAACGAPTGPGRSGC
jgi:predicted TIM-barrel fold metal-dependent hydrolase